jgi:microcystin-dependent protein
MAEISNLDPIDVNNIGRFPENMQFRNVNDGGRALEGLLARWFKDTNCSLTASGTNNAYAVTANRVLSAYSDSLIVGFTPNHTNTGAATLNVSGLGAKTIVRPNGDTALAGDIVNGSKVLVIYVQSPVDKFLLLSMPATSASISLAVGAVMAWPTENIPAGCLLADGSAVSRTTYAALFAAYGTRYGFGDGATTFNLPNYKDYFLRGHDASGTDAGSRADRGDGTTGANVGTKQTAATKNHTHTASVTDPGHQHSMTLTLNAIAGSPAVQFVTEIAPTGLAATRQVASNTTGITVANSTTGYSANETRAKNITVNWIIVATPAAALVTSGIGRNETEIDISRMTARVTSGAGSATRDAGASDITQPVFDFDKTTQEYVHFSWRAPKRWNKGTVTFVAEWTADAGSAAETVAWTLQGVAISDGDDLNATFGSAQTSTDTLQATGKKHTSPESGLLTIAGSPATADLVVFQISRDVAVDNLDADARLLKLVLLWTSNATSDD